MRVISQEWSALANRHAQTFLLSAVTSALLLGVCRLNTMLKTQLPSLKGCQIAALWKIHDPRRSQLQVTRMLLTSLLLGHWTTPETSLLA